MFALLVCSCGCLRFLGVGVLGWGGGAVWSCRPLCPACPVCLLALFGCLLAHASGVGVVGVCAVGRLPPCVRG